MTNLRYALRPAARFMMLAAGMLAPRVSPAR